MVNDNLQASRNVKTKFILYFKVQEKIEPLFTQELSLKYQAMAVCRHQGLTQLMDMKK